MDFSFFPYGRYNIPFKNASACICVQDFVVDARSVFDKRYLLVAIAAPSCQGRICHVAVDSRVMISLSLILQKLVQRGGFTAAHWTRPDRLQVLRQQTTGR